MGQGITVDISARVVGYENSIKQLQATLAKIDPGSDLGKSITRALQQAEGQVKQLGKNMFPKATSDTQIDNIIEKTNRAGEAIQNVARMMQQISVGDLNLGALGGEIEQFRNEISTLQNELDSKLNAGLIKAINESSELSGVFKQLGTDLSTADMTKIFEDISRGAKQAAADTQKAEAELAKVRQEKENRQAAITSMQALPLGTLEGHQNLDKQLEEIATKYESFLSDLRERMAQGMSKLALPETGRNSVQSLLDSFFNDLKPENFQEK